MWIFLLSVGLVVLTIVATVKMNDEEKLVEKAETNWFYHAIAKMVVSNYKGYYPNEGEVEASKKFVREKSEYDSHPVGSYLKMRKECNDMLKTAGNFHGYNIAASTGGSGIGFAVMLVFAAIIALGVAYC